MSKGFLTTVVTLLILVFAGAMMYYGYELVQQYQTPEPVVEEQPTFAQLFSQGLAAFNAEDYERAAGLFEQAAQLAETDEERAQAEHQAGLSNFETGDSQKQIKGIGQLKQSIVRTDVPERQADAIDDLAASVCKVGCNETFVTEIFNSEPFDSYFDNADPEHSVTLLHEWAVSLAPIPRSYVKAATWYADQVLLNIDDFSAQQIEDFTAIADYYLSQAEAVETGNDISDVSYHAERGYVYGALATVDEEAYGQKFDEAYRQVIVLGGPAPDGSDESYTLQIGYYEYAAFLDLIYGEVREDDVMFYLRTLSELVVRDTNEDHNFRTWLQSMLDKEGTNFVKVTIDALSESNESLQMIVDDNDSAAESTTEAG